uniref:Uncharacterized protein n=1 Tax=Nelumbo nucifera TaxID=4432 RepID=A0A822Y1Y8_NELNU|nr:TPA_asm: hypothetical protein HUJ06_027005 [Nelumbo nucifera]
MGEGGGTAHFRVQSGQRLPSEENYRATSNSMSADALKPLRVSASVFLLRKHSGFLRMLGLFGARPLFRLDVGARQAPGKYRLAPSSISAGILLSRGWGPGANYSCAVLPQPKEGHLVRSYGPVVDKPLRGGDWTGVLSSNDACGLSSQVVARFGLAWPGREEIHIETTAIRE